MNIKLKISFVVALLFLAICPLVAQEKADTTYTFRFVPQKDMFYVPLDGNDRELARLLECVRRNKDSILGVFRSMWTATAIPLTAKRKTCG